MSRVSQVVSERKFGDGGRGGIRTHGRVTADGFRDRCFQPDSATLPHGAPGENRTHHELLCRQSLRQLASGAKWRGTRDSNPVMPGLESGALPIEPVPRGAGPGSRTRKHLILSQAAIPIRQSGNGASGRIRTGKHGDLSSAADRFWYAGITWWPAPESNRENLFSLSEAPLPV